ncbi:Glycosyl transferase family 2 [Catalinimonas alkaloidigena]|uniref:Glycosyl transferase family 2 n=1 Tax=Catalinimonas alkaloidigena TaxID=1075417 RepID=A0A1G9LIG7_9BACT|nr:glycosyltransferase family A protein [Catalinimonas alkaloidigena]SDL61638.1 Glycosyl transferase family 2 [Catalinimonas alkaloidigena]
MQTSQQDRAEEPLVSIIVPLYNRAAMLEETIRSVTTQRYTHWELLLVDDGSTDATVEIAASYAQHEKRITLLKRDRLPKGAPTCRNIGFQHARGEYIIFLDSDDLLAPHCLEQRVQTMQQHPNCDFLVFPMLLFQQHPYDDDKVWNVDTQEDDLTRFLRLDAVWQTTGPIYKRNVIATVGGFHEGLSCWQDYDLHMRILLSDFSYRKCFAVEPDCFYRIHVAESISQATYSKAPQKIHDRAQVLLEIRKRLIGKHENHENRRALATAILAVANDWVVMASDLWRGWALWRVARQENLIGRKEWLGGTLHLMNDFLFKHKIHASELIRKVYYLTRVRLVMRLLPPAILEPSLGIFRHRQSALSGKNAV